jgi:hypothetical protein
MRALELDDTIAEAHASLGNVDTGMNGIGPERKPKSSEPLT